MNTSFFIQFKILVPVALAATTFILPLSADEPVFKLTPYVATIAARETPTRSWVDPKAPAQPIPVEDGAGVLKTVPGFTLIRKGGTSSDPMLRGMAGSRLGMLLGGESILGGCGNRMDPPTAYVFPSAYDRVTIIKGPQTVLYGPGQSAGVVLFERDALYYPVPAVDLDGTLAVGSFGRNDARLSLSAGAPLGYVRLDANHTAAGDYRDGSGRRVHSSYDRWSLQGALTWTHGPATLLEWTGILSDGEAAYADRAMDGTLFARENTGLRWQHEPAAGEVEKIEAQVFYNYVDHVMDNFSMRSFKPNPMMPHRTVSNPDRETIGGRAQVSFLPVPSLRLEVGGDHQENRHSMRRSMNEASNPYREQPRVRDAEFRVTGLFAEAMQEAGESGRIVSGLRIDLWKARDLRDRIRIGHMGTQPNPTAGEGRRSELPSGFVRYEHDRSEATQLSLGVGHSRRFPDYWELFNKESETDLSAFHVAPERVSQIDAGLQYETGHAMYSLALFANRINDYILIERDYPKGMRTTAITRNIDASAWGGEGAIQYDFADGWRADLSITYVYGKNRTDGIPLAQQPPLESRLALSYSTATWSVGWLTRAVARQSRVALNQGNIVGQDISPSGGFTVYSLNGSWSPTPRCRISAGVDNVFDRTYAEHLSRGGSMVAGFPPPTMRVNEPGRTLWATVRITL